jgi:multiple sugar transport system ATP-binding protein
MNAGRIEQAGPPLELYDKPANRFVAGFLGSPAMSFIDGRIEQGGRTPSVRTRDGMAVPAVVSGSVGERAVEIGIRPEDFRIDGGDGLPFTVDVVEPTGAETHLFGTIEGTEVRCVSRDRVTIAPGTTLNLTVAPERIHVFDKATGDRL